MNHYKMTVAALMLLVAGGAPHAVAQHPINDTGVSLFDLFQQGSDAQYDRLLEKKAELQKLSEAIGNEGARIDREARRLAEQGQQLDDRGVALDQEVYSFKEKGQWFRQESQALDAAEARMQREGAAIEAWRSRVRSNADVAALNQRIRAYNARLGQLKARMQRYNASLRQRNQWKDRLNAARQQLHRDSVDHGAQTTQIERRRAENERLRDDYNVRSRQLSDDFAEWRQHRTALKAKQQGGTHRGTRATPSPGRIWFSYDKDAPKSAGQ